MKKLSPRAKGFVKLGFVALLFYFLAQKGLISLEETRRALDRLDLVFSAIAFMVLNSILAVVRWQGLLRAQSFQLPWRRTFQLSFIGNFFNLALPGAVSGDFVKAYYVAHETHGERGRVFGTILFDRVAGVSALVLVSAGALALSFETFRDTPLLKAISFLVTAAACGVLTFYSFLFLVNERRDPFLAALKFMQGRMRWVASLTRIYQGLRHYHLQRRAVLIALGISIVIHVSTCTAAWLFLQALGEGHVDAQSLFVVVPLGMLVTAVPITPAGVGTGHAAFGWLFRFLGTARGADVFSWIVIAQLVPGAVGGLIYLRFRARVVDQEIQRVLATAKTTPSS